MDLRQTLIFKINSVVPIRTQLKLNQEFNESGTRSAKEKAPLMGAFSLAERTERDEPCEARFVSHMTDNL